METRSNETDQWPCAVPRATRGRGAKVGRHGWRTRKRPRGDGVKLLTIDGSGWHYSRVGKILDAQKFKAAPLQVWEPGDGTEASLVMMGMARGSSTTDGYHELGIPRAVP